MTVTPDAPTTMGMPEAPQPKKRIRRNPSRSARFHSSKRGVDDGKLVAAFRWTKERAVREFARIRWGSCSLMPCPVCGTIDRHPFNAEKCAWRCANQACRSDFSPTVNTVFSKHKRSLASIYIDAATQLTPAAGSAHITSRALMGTGSYNTTYTTMQKIREGLVRGNNQGFLVGVVEVDGAHSGGHRSAERRGLPLAQARPETQEEKDAQAQAVLDAFNAKAAKSGKAQPKALSQKEVRLGRRASQNTEVPEEAPTGTGTENANVPAAPAEKDRGGAHDPLTRRKLPAERRIVISICARSGHEEYGAQLTRVGVAMSEDTSAVEHLIHQHVLKPESILATDESPAYNKIGKEFRLHLRVNHSKELVGPEGDHVNMAESFNARHDRAEAGSHLNIQPKYLLDYVCGMAFRQDTRTKNVAQRTDAALYWALNVGLSQYWVGFTKGRHRVHELTVPHHQYIGRSSGPRPRKSTNGVVDMTEMRPPR